MFLKGSALFLQATPTLENAESVESVMVSQSPMDILISGGLIGIFIYVVLLILSIIAVYIFFERYSAINRSEKIDQHFMNNIRSNVAAGNIPAARALCQATDSPVSRLVEKGLQRIGKPLRDIDAAVENAGNLEVFRLEKNLSSLASIAGAAPMIGFFGTVTGMILAFYNMASQQNVTPSLLAGGIYQALLTTAFGLAIGIFAFVGYNLLVAKVDKVIYMMERTTTEFMDMLHE
ncbi:MAG: MotA/TolQ/ExbB proton channel family protein [Saprospiraceae bacterium]|jgi:biopolymer transport protein ExbB|nr:MotA/TolQ/ExbB proton channel family protein [Saprospiraceae bacterium]MDP4700877.1 MotA/TolQ/ExbB proton channel family protein [Saprospiraceae bacterium]MDP4812791.1 MotA/TolQ/ExbB proton channel family protein [Saprospiraceae bacterium]MDP4813103.1 MotA/TolQ/ExbB proton channel family protein [Saprospiraceae bacterium]MDP4852230.1 MotA/TolQ/ExbB proton channel family protein [Saprospiraceae bacterium]